MPDFFEVALSRRSVKAYDPEAHISKEELEEVLETAGRAPSAWNLQQWHFLVFHGKEVQEKLLPLAYNQQQIVEASAVVCILGDLEAHLNIDSVFDPQVESGEITPELKEILAGQINGAYKRTGYPREGAILNSSLAAMQFMLAARAKGYDTCPIGGFNVSGLTEAFNVPDRYLPTMLVTIGTKLEEGRPTDRLPIGQLVTYAK